MRSPSYTRLNLNNIVHKYFREREKKKRRETVGLNGFPSQSFPGRKKKKETLRLCVCVCAYTSVCFFIFPCRSWRTSNWKYSDSFFSPLKKVSFWFNFIWDRKKSWERPWFSPSVIRRRFTRDMSVVFKFWKTRALILVDGDTKEIGRHLLSLMHQLDIAYTTRLCVC